MGERDIVYVVDDDSLTRDWLALALTECDVEPQVFASGLTFVAGLGDLQPGPVLLDLRMPDLDGLQTLEAIGPVRILRFPTVMMTGHGEVASAVRAMKLGAVDFLEKPFEHMAMVGALEWASVQLRSTLAAARERERAEALLTRLSPRERDVLEGLVQGLPNKLLAHRLDLSVRTVEMHRSKLMNRLGTRSFSEALRIAFAGGLDAGWSRTA